MNFIGLDISKISTAMVIIAGNDEHIFSYNTSKPSYKWNKELSSLVNIKTYEYDKDEENYSKSEVNKLTVFTRIANDLMNDILTTIDQSAGTVVVLEGYSYSSGDSGPLIDLVGIASIIRNKVLEQVPNLLHIEIVSPSQLKCNACAFAYGYSEVTVGKKNPRVELVMNTNPAGMKGGNFTKHDIFKSIIDGGKPYKLMEFCMSKHDEIMGVKSFPKPLEDIDDAKIAVSIAADIAGKLFGKES